MHHQAGRAGYKLSWRRFDELMQGHGSRTEARQSPRTDRFFRVFYQVNPESREVRILAVGVKERSRLYFGGEEFEE
jgi:hypothetical protein